MDLLSASLSIPLPLIFELLVLGLVTGLLAGLLGIGGGMLMVPFITIILTARGFPPVYTVKMAVATSLATICFTSLSSVRAHHQHGAVRWDIARVLAPGILVGSFVGAQFAAALPARALSMVFAVFIAVLSLRMLFSQPSRATRGLPGATGMFGVGSVIGVLSSIVGAGGAFLSVPFMTRCGISIHQAVATSSSLGFPIALAGTIGYLVAGWNLPDMPPGALGYLYLPGLVLVSMASVATAPLGARLAHRMNVAPLRRVFALMLLGVAVWFALR